VRLEGPGVLRVQAPGQQGEGAFINALGTTSDSVLTVERKQTRPLLASLGINRRLLNVHASGDPLPIGRIRVATGQLGGIVAPDWAELVGPVSPLQGNVRTIQLEAIGPAARIDIAGNLGSPGDGQPALAASRIELGPDGRIQVGGSVLGSIHAGSLALDGGQLVVAQDLDGVTALGALEIGGTTTQPGRLVVGRDWNGPLVVHGDATIRGGELTVGRDSSGGAAIQGTLRVVQGGRWAIGRNLNRSIRVQGNLDLTGGTIRSQVISAPPGTDVMIIQTGVMPPGGDGTVQVDGSVTT
jgi:hypothetical protein